MNCHVEGVKVNLREYIKSFPTCYIDKYSQKQEPVPVGF